jgi:hypothetical protein
MESEEPKLPAVRSIAWLGLLASSGNVIAGDFDSLSIRRRVRPLLKVPSSAPAVRVEITNSRNATLNLSSHDFYGVPCIGCDPDKLVTSSFKARNESLDLFDIGLRYGCGITAVQTNASHAASE